jgi:hypothetical protein
MYTSAFVGAILGFLLTGLLTDWSANLLTRWNKGVYEPEFRLVLVLPQLVLGSAGLYGFGWTASDIARYGWFWPDFFFALVVMGMVCGAVSSALYIVDAHREYPCVPTTTVIVVVIIIIESISLLTNTIGDMSVEGFTCLLVFKNLFSFGLTFKGFDWLISAGNVKRVFIPVGSVQVAVCALTIPMCKSRP